MDKTTIQVSKYVKKKLDEIKERNGHSSMDSTIRSLINECEKQIAYWAGIVDDFEKMPQEELAKRERFYLQMKKLNKTGRDESRG